MAKYCRGCSQFKGTIKTCKICGLPFCSDCRAMGSICKDCYMAKNSSTLIGDYYNEKYSAVVH